MAALQRTRRRSSSAFAGAIILGIAYSAAAGSLFVKVEELGKSWAGNLVDGHVQFSWAGWRALLVSLPLFWFLVFGWLWRFVVLTCLLWDVVELKLQLVATHPDLRGGIGFLGFYPVMFSVLAFALSCVTAASGLQWSLKSIAAPFLMWAALVLIFSVGPLIVFTPSLVRLKRRALLEYGVLACIHPGIRAKVGPARSVGAGCSRHARHLVPAGPDDRGPVDKVHARGPGRP